MPSIATESHPGVSQVKLTRPHMLTDLTRKRQKRPSSWSERVKDSLFSRTDAKTRVRSHSHGEDGPPGQASASLAKSTEPRKGSLLKLREYKGKNKLATIGETGQAEQDEIASDSGTVRKAPKSSTLRATNKPMDPPGTRTANGKHARTVSRDDYLTARGANPRTGVVSPSLTSHSSNSRSFSSHDEQLINKDAGMDTKWRLKGNQWISLDKNAKTPLPSPSSGKPSEMGLSDAEGKAWSYLQKLQQRGVRHSQVGDQFVVNMPSAREPCPRTMTTNQIFEFQRAIDQVYRNGGNPMDPAAPPEPAQETQALPPTRLPSNRYYRGRRPGARPRNRNMPPYPQGNGLGLYPAPGPRQKHFLDGKAKGTQSQTVSNRHYPSPPWMMATPQEDLQNQARPADMRKESTAPIRQQLRRMQSENLLERRGQEHMSLRPLSAPTFLPCPKPTAQEDALTTITITTDTPIPTTKIHLANESPGQSPSPSPAGEMEEHCASASPICQRNPDTAFVVNHPENVETVATVENEIQSTTMEMPMERPSHMPTNRRRDNRLLRTWLSSPSWLRVLWFILHCVVGVLMYCVNASKELYMQLRPNPKHLKTRTTRRTPSGIMDYWIVFVFLISVINAIWKIIVYISKLALANP